MFSIKNKRLNVFNKIILVGNLTRDIEVRFTASNLAIGSTGIATNKKFKSQMGEEKEEVMFLDITFFGRTAEIANQYLRKGSKILVDGRLKLDQWTDKNGQKRAKHSLVVESMKMLGGREEERSVTEVPRYQTNESVVEQVSSPEVALSLSEEEVPF